MLIGLGGGAAVSVASGDRAARTLDFASVQRDNPEMERRCQEVIDRCVALGDDNPIRFDARRRRRRPVERDPRTAARLRRRRRDRPGEGAQRRSVAVADAAVVQRIAGALRARRRRRTASPSSRRSARASAARSPWSATPPPKSACVGRRHGRHAGAAATTARSTCRWTCCSASRRRCIATPRARRRRAGRELDTAALDLREAGLRVLAHPTVAAKNFLVTIGDRTVGGLTARDQMVGPWQLPVADCAITLDRLRRLSPAKRWRSASARRWRCSTPPPPRAWRSARRSPTCAPRRSTRSIGVKLSANWMAAAGHAGEDARCSTRCARSAWNCARNSTLSIPVGKDSLSMQAQWHGRRRSAAEVGVAGVADRHRVRAASPTCARS